MPADPAVAQWRPSAAYIFLSYARENAEAARHVRDLLQGAGLRVWIDEERLHRNEPESLVSERIWDTLASTTDVVAIVSRASLGKPWVVHEWQTAATRWLAGGSPRIHLLTLEQDAAVPDLPFASVTPYADAGRLVSAIGNNPVVEIPSTPEGWERVASQLRVEYLMGGVTAVRALHRLDALWSALQERMDAAARAGFTGPDAHAATLLRLLGPLLDLRADRDWLVAHLTAASLSDCVPVEERCRLQNNLGVLHGYRGEWRDATRWTRQAIAHCESLGDVSGVAVGIGNLALLALEAGAYDVSMTEIGRARQVLASARHQAGGSADRNLATELANTEGILLNHEGCVHALRGQFDDAARCFSEHLAIAEILEQRRFIAVALGRLAWTDVLRGRTDWRTRLGFQRYRHLAIATLNPRGAANAAAWEAQLCLAEGNPVQAAAWLQQELELRELLQERVDRCRSLAWSVITAVQGGTPGDAASLAERLREAVRSVELGQPDAALMARAFVAAADVRASVRPADLNE